MKKYTASLQWAAVVFGAASLARRRAPRPAPLRRARTLRPSPTGAPRLVAGAGNAGGAALRQFMQAKNAGAPAPELLGPPPAVPDGPVSPEEADRLDTEFSLRQDVHFSGVGRAAKPGELVLCAKGSVSAPELRVRTASGVETHQRVMFNPDVTVEVRDGRICGVSSGAYGAVRRISLAVKRPFQDQASWRAHPAGTSPLVSTQVGNLCGAKSYSLPPCGGGWGWGVRPHPRKRGVSVDPPPHPNPPPQGGRETCVDTNGTSPAARRARLESRFARSKFSRSGCGANLAFS